MKKRINEMQILESDDKYYITLRDEEGYFQEIYRDDAEIEAAIIMLKTKLKGNLKVQWRAAE